MFKNGFSLAYVRISVRVAGRPQFLTSIFTVVDLFLFLPKTGPGGPGRCLKSFLEAARFILTEYGPVGSHRDPVRAHVYS